MVDHNEIYCRGKVTYFRGKVIYTGDKYSVLTSHLNNNMKILLIELVSFINISIVLQ